MGQQRCAGSARAKRIVEISAVNSHIPSWSYGSARWTNARSRRANQAPPALLGRSFLRIFPSDISGWMFGQDQCQSWTKHMLNCMQPRTLLASIVAPLLVVAYSTWPSQGAEPDPAK